MMWLDIYMAGAIASLIMIALNVISDLVLPPSADKLRIPPLQPSAWIAATLAMTLGWPIVMPLTLYVTVRDLLR